MWLSDKESACHCRRHGFNHLLGRSPEEEMATHSGILAWKIPWTKEPGRLRSTRLQRVRQLSDWWAHMCDILQPYVGYLALPTWKAVRLQSNGCNSEHHAHNLWFWTFIWRHYFLCPEFFICLSYLFKHVVAWASLLSCLGTFRILEINMHLQATV